MMQNNEKTKSLLSDITIIILCVCGSLLCIFLFYRDINISLYKIGEQPVGTITFRYNMAQRRFVDRLFWDRLRNESPLYNGDVIRTADLSEATITFIHGDIVDIYSNTLIQIFADSTGAWIEFSGGGINVNAQSENGVGLRSGNNRFRVNRGSSARASSFSNGNFDLSVSRGSASYQNNQGARGDYTAGSSLYMDAAGNPLNIPQAVATSPSGSRFLSQDEQGSEIDFAWNKINYPQDALTRLEISYDRSFERIYFTDDIKEDNRSVVLPEGTWFWRLYPAVEQTQTEIEIPYSRISVVLSRVPSLISPIQEQVIGYRSRFPSIRFQWTSSQDASSYILEASDNPAMDKPALVLHVRSGTGSQLSVVSSELEAGIWYWRVTPVYGRDFSGTLSPSIVQSFSIERSDVLSPPVLTSPADGSYVNIETGRRDVVFSWRRDNEASSYTIRISANSNMSNPVIEQTVTSSFYRYGTGETILTQGTWYWAVMQQAFDGQLSEYSQPRMFAAINGEIINRLVFPPDNYSIADNFLPDTRFTWKTNLDDIRFQVSQNAAFGELLIDEAAPAESFTIRSLQSGLYYWRVTGSDGTNRRETQARRFAISSSLLPPDISRSHSGTIVVVQGTAVEFSWDRVQGAEYYAFKILQDDIPVIEELVFGTRVQVNMDDLADGLYTWSVQALSRESATSSRRTGIAATQGINVRQLRPVILQHPRDGFSYEGVDASRKPDTARWASLEVPVDVRLVIARDARMTNVVYRADNVSSSFVLPRLVSGNYFWTIHAMTIDGIDISARAPAQFRVLPIPPLPAPQNRRPQDGNTVTAADVRTARTINFSWNSVQGANGYILTVFHNTGSSRRTLVQTEVLTTTRHEMEVRQLARGNLFWQVEAVFVMDDLIEQRGVLQENRLVMDIPAPVDINTRDSGVLYGR